MNLEDLPLIFFVNGKKVVEKHTDPEWTLLFYLRNKLRLCGTKLGCAEGGCGACTVMISKYDRRQQKILHLAVNACLAPVCAMHGLAVTTIEGIGSTRTRLHPVQERIAKAHGSQCGFCTPGIVMSMYTLLRNSPKPSMDDLELAFQGNLCRCTGYRPIIEGYKTFTEEWETLQQNGSTNGEFKCQMGDQCCRLQNGHKEQELFDPGEFTPYDPSQEPIFPPELKLYDTLDGQNLIFKGKTVTWRRPTNLKQLLKLKADHPDSKIIVGNTEVGVEVKFKRLSYPFLIQPAQISELHQLNVTDSGLTVGASTTLQDLDECLKIQIRTQPEFKTRIFSAIVEMLRWFAGKQIRNVAAIGGNIMTGSPISDLNPILVAAQVLLDVQSQRGRRKVAMDENFFTGYRKNILRDDEILVAVNIPFTKEDQYFYGYKQARRRDDDIAIVNAAFNIVFKKGTEIVELAKMGFGGMAPTTVTAPKTEEALIGLSWDDVALETACKNLVEDLPLPPSAPGGMILYRRSLTIGMFYRAHLNICKRLGKFLDDRELTGADSFPNEVPKNSQYFQLSSDEEKTSVGRPIVHASALKQATGEAIYCDDMPSFENELYMAFVLSSKPHAKILHVDASEALQMDGVAAFVSAKDLPGSRNRCGPIFHDEEIFASKVVTWQGQTIGVVLAEDQATAQCAARKVAVSYEELEPVIVTIEEAIKMESYFSDCPRKIEKGDVDEVFRGAFHIVEGDCRTGGQEHFYLETQCAIAVPKMEDDEMEIYSSTQHPSELTKLIAHALDVQQNKIVTKVKRLGGGFGGKESKGAMVAVPAAIAASLLRRPVRCMLDRDEDMLMTGTRHPFYFKYKVAFDDEGKMSACEVYLYNNAGSSKDLSPAVLERAMFHITNSYKIPAVRVIGYVCKTNLPSNTAFRGFGGPQGMFAAENIIRDIAEYLDKDPVEIARLNLFRDGDLTHYNQKLENCTLLRCWDECANDSNYHVRKREIETFNEKNRWKKRGIAMVPTQFGISFTAPFLNQAGALLLVYTDGSVLLTHGGTEMGQGLHTKMIQIASTVLEIPISKIHISETATDKVPNTSPTAASASSDLNGMAVMNACLKIKERLKPYRLQNPKGKWEDWVEAAYLDRISLSATGFYKTPLDGYDWETNSGDAFYYFTNGAACSEVEIDCLTGDHRVLRTDIVMDVGDSLNPAIDVGQVEGGFMQGYGMFMIEETVYSPNGTLFTRGPGTYKIPGFTSIPLEFNVSLLKGAANPRAVFSSKAVGEPPLFLASSVLFAAREAIKNARKDAEIQAPFRLNAPATCSRIRLGCQDHILSQLPEPEEGTYSPWNVIL